ncbi:MAG: nitroreductase family protein [Clostridiales Family XIII bacterium]|jgi:nitroreductase|nr:nitroreductase family protein [Clostridiales Family XIII bacterium]
MELKEAMHKRQSVRKFKADDVPNADISEMIEAARVAPSGKNLQNWHFIVIKNRELIDKAAEAVRSKNEEISKRMDVADKTKGDRFRKFAKNFTLFFTGAPVLIVVMTETYIPSGYAEYEFIGADPQILDDLMRYRNPGMQSLGAAVEHLYLRAVDLGYGCCWLTSANYAAAAIEELVRAEAGFDKEGYYMAALIALGVPDGASKSPGRKTPEEIYTLVE